MTARSRRGLFAAFAVGIIGVLAIGASSASAVSVTGQPVAFKAFVDNGFSGTLVGVNGGVVAADCSSQDLEFALVGTASNGLAKSNYSDENNDEDTFSADDLDNGEAIPLNDATVGTHVIGHAEFANGQDTRTMSVNYSTEDGGVGPNGTRSDCAAWGSVIKGIY